MTSQEKLQLFIENIWVKRISRSFLIILVSLILYYIVSNTISKSVENGKLKIFSNKKAKTYVRLIKNILRYIFIIGDLFLILETFNVNISSLLAGVGILGVVFGLAIQDFIKDIIRGSTILSDNYFEVGDIVKYKDIEGKVLLLGLKTTKIKDLKTNNVISIANRNIEQIEVVSNVIYVDIPLPYEVSLKKAEKAIQDIIEILSNDTVVKNAKYIGVTELADSSIKYLLEIECNPSEKRQARRNTLHAILEGLSKNKISVPFNQIDVHQK